MSTILGRVLWSIVLPLTLFGAHRWDAKIGANEAVVGEAVELYYTCRFDDTAYGTSITLELPKEDDDFRYVVLNEDEHIIDGRRVNGYRFVLFAKHAGDLSIAPTALFRKTSREQVENAVIGRDNMEYYQFAKSRENVPKVSLHVKPSYPDLTGELALHVTHSKAKIAPFEPFHLSLELSGYGNLDTMKAIAIDAGDAQVFREAPKRDIRLSNKGYEGRIIQKFAFVGEHNFTIPRMDIAYFDVAKRRVEHLIMERQVVEVRSPYRKEELLDKVGEPDKNTDGTFVYYMFTLLSGVILGWYARLLWQQKRHTRKVQSAKNVKTLLRDLALQGGHEALIDRAEREGWSLGKIEKALTSRNH